MNVNQTSRYTSLSNQNTLHVVYEEPEHGWITTNSEYHYCLSMLLCIYRMFLEAWEPICETEMDSLPWEQDAYGSQRRTVNGDVHIVGQFCTKVNFAYWQYTQN